VGVRSIKTGMLALACLSGLGLYFDRALAEAQSPPASKATASFSHDTKGHKALDCAKCHTISAAQIDVKKFPGHLSCTPCHNFALEFFAKPVAFCGICHEGRAVSKSQPAIFQFPKKSVRADFGLDFSHPSHIKPAADRAESSRCAACHQKAGPVNMTIETGHAACFKCHGEKPLAGPSMFDCGKCHRLGFPHAPRLFGVVREFRHADHDYEVRSIKKGEFRAVKAEDIMCYQCHQAVAHAARLDEIRLPEPSHCRECHNGRVGLPDALPQSVLDSLSKR